MAMDFSGQKSRVIENPSEALSVAVEEGLSWRVSQGIAHKTFSTRETAVRDFSQFCKQFCCFYSVKTCKTCTLDILVNLVVISKINGA